MKTFTKDKDGHCSALAVAAGAIGHLSGHSALCVLQQARGEWRLRRKLILHAMARILSPAPGSKQFQLN